MSDFQERLDQLSITTPLSPKRRETEAKAAVVVYERLKTAIAITRDLMDKETDGEVIKIAYVALGLEEEKVLSDLEDRLSNHN